MVAASTLASLALRASLMMPEPRLEGFLESCFEGSTLRGEHAAHLLEQGGAEEDRDALAR